MKLVFSYLSMKIALCSPWYWEHLLLPPAGCNDYKAGAVTIIIYEHLLITDIYKVSFKARCGKIVSKAEDTIQWSTRLHSLLSLTLHSNLRYRDKESEA